MKIVTILGARPQFIKAAVVSREIAKHNEINEIIIHTGQHYDTNMSEIFFEEMQIPKPDYYLGINGLNHGAMTGQMLENIEKVLLKEKPDFVLVYGDTNSTLAGALAAKKLHIKVAHVEAGLRSFNMKMPEEINRIITDRISNVLFCPTDNAVYNLEKEGFGNFDCNIIKSGDVMYDAALFYAEMISKKSNIVTALLAKNIDLSEGNFILCTIHRAENIDYPDRLCSIWSAFSEISKKIPIILPVHPRTKLKLKESGIDLETNDENLTLLDPIGYFDMLELLKRCKLVMTDSGGLQKEAYFFEKLCITLRDETEWVELVEAGVNVVVGSNKEKIYNAFDTLKDSRIVYSEDFYGNGNASAIIISCILL